MNPASEPPYYILVSQSALASNPQGPQSTSLAHPTIQYHYADDPPLSLLPQSPSEHLIILGHDPAQATPTGKSISKDLIVSSVKVSEAPAAAASDDEQGKRNDRMYILELTSAPNPISAEEEAEGMSQPEMLLAQFRQRNSILRQALNFPTQPDDIYIEGGVEKLPTPSG